MHRRRRRPRYMRMKGGEIISDGSVIAPPEEAVSQSTQEVRRLLAHIAALQKATEEKSNSYLIKFNQLFDKALASEGEVNIAQFLLQLGEPPSDQSYKEITLDYARLTLAYLQTKKIRVVNVDSDDNVLIKPVTEIPPSDVVAYLRKLELDSLRKGRLNSLTEELRSEGRRFNVFANLSQVMVAIENDEVVEGVNIVAQLYDENYRFICNDKPELSLQTSKAMQKLIQNTRSIAPKIAAKKHSQNADEYATKVFEVIENLKRVNNVSSFRKTVEMLNKSDVATPNGGRWRVNLLQDLYKRFEKLGLKQNDVGPE